ncbi:hypothetical protein GCM10027256_37380 [Novispirillum itersonii subsp. nipponicum]
MGDIQQIMTVQRDMDGVNPLPGPPDQLRQPPHISVRAGNRQSPVAWAIAKIPLRIDHQKVDTSRYHCPAFRTAVAFFTNIPDQGRR